MWKNVLWFAGSVAMAVVIEEIRCRFLFEKARRLLDKTKELLDKAISESKSAKWNLESAERLTERVNENIDRAIDKRLMIKMPEDVDYKKRCEELEAIEEKMRREIAELKGTIKAYETVHGKEQK